MKADIVTFHSVPNYGAVLQAYALQEYLKTLCDKVEIVDYRPNELLHEYKRINTYSFFSIAHSLWSLFPYTKKLSKFAKFRSNFLSLSKSTGKNIEELGTITSDVVFLGSDQIWNPEITNGVDSAYFGKFKWLDQPTIASYAASVGKAEFTLEEQGKIVCLLKDVDFVSVREDEAKQLLSPYTDKEIYTVVDPTILAGRQCFDNLVNSVPLQNYVLIYSLTGNPDTEAMAVKVSKYLEAPIVELSGRRKGFVKKNHKTIYTAGPTEFVSLIANATYIVTDSFHGTAFSLLYHKKFISIPHKTRGGRIINLLSICNLSDRMTNKFEKELIDNDIRWEDVDSKIAYAKEKSEDYIKEVISHCEKII